MEYFLAIVGIVISFFMVKEREQLGNMLGDPDWAASIGGIYTLITIAALFIFFWSLATITGTSDILFYYVFQFFSLGRGKPAEIPTEF